MEKICTVNQVKVILNSQRDEIIKECNLISKFLKRIPREIDLKKELPDFNFKGQTIDNGSDISFVCEGDSYQYLELKNEFVLTGEENEVVTKTISAYVISAENKAFCVEVKLVFANPIISNSEITVRSGHYFLVECGTVISYGLNEELFYSFRKVLNRDEINEKIAEYYLNQRIKFKIMPASQKFKHQDSDTIKMLMKEGILNKKLFFKKSAINNSGFSIVTEITRCRKNLGESKIVTIKRRKTAVAGLYLGNQSDVVIVTKTLYIKVGETRMYLGKTEKVFPVQKFKGPISFTSIDYYKKCWHTNIPRSIEYK